MIIPTIRGTDGLENDDKCRNSQLHGKSNHLSFVIYWWSYHKSEEDLGGGQRVMKGIIDVNDDNRGWPLR